MKITVDINHPGHVHFFKNFIWEMEKKGHETLITALDKDVTYDLLDHYGFEYLKLGQHKKSMLKKIADLPPFRIEGLDHHHSTAGRSKIGLWSKGIRDFDVEFHGLLLPEIQEWMNLNTSASILTSWSRDSLETLRLSV